MTFLLFCFYLFLCTGLICRLPIFRNSGIPQLHLAGYYWAKVACGVFYGYFFQKWERGGDTWSYHRDGLMETDMLRKDPLAFVTTLFDTGNAEGYGGFFSTHHSWWNNLDANTIPKLLGIFNLFTNSSYYVNVVLVNALFVLGPVLTYRLARNLLPKISPILLYAPLLLPSFLFWTSGIHKEGFLFIALSAILFAAWHVESNRKGSLQVMAGFTAGLLVVIALRNFLVLPLGAALLGWAVTVKYRIKPVFGFGTTLLVLAALFFKLPLFVPALNFPEIFAERQAAFLTKKGDSWIAIAALEPTASGFLVQLPRAAVLGLFRPLPGDDYNLGSALAATEGLAVLLCTFVAGFGLRKQVPAQAFLWLLATFCTLVVLVIGYTIPFLGAIVRYRSIILPFWMFLCIYILKGSSKEQLKKAVGQRTEALEYSSH